MKKFSKIVLTAMLSLSLCVSSVVAVNALNVSNDVNAATVAMADYAKAIKTENGGVASYVQNEAQVSAADYKYTGIKLSGPANAAFHLGTFDIGASNWAGTGTATAPSTETDKNVPLFEFTFSPSRAIDKATEDGTGKYNANFVFTQGDKELTVRIRNYGHATEDSSVSFFAQGNGQSKMGGYRYNSGFKTGGDVIIKKLYTVQNAANMGLTLANNAVISPIGNSQAAVPVYYDFNDVAVYTPIGFTGSHAQLDKSFLIRDLDATDASNGSDTQWEGFTKDADGKCLVDVKVWFYDMQHDNTVIVTKIGNTSFDSALESDVNVVSTGNELAGVEVNLTKYLYTAPVGENIKFPVNAFDGSIKVGADEATATAISGVAYTFQTSTNVYFYDAEGELLGSTAVSVIEEAPIAVSVTGGKAYYKRGDAEKVLINSETKFKIGDVITVEGGKFALLDQPIEDVKNFIVNGVEKATIVNNVATKIEGFEYVITADDITAANSNIEVVLDNYCDVTFIDEYDGNKTVYGWQNGGGVDYPYASSRNPGASYGASGGEALLLGYYRYDAENYKEGAENGWNFYRTYASKVGVESDDADSNFEKFEALTKGMKFEAVYIKAEIISEYNVETNEVNIYLQVDQAHADNWKTLVAPTSEKPRLRMGYKFVDSTTSTALYSLDATMLDTYQIGGAYVPLVNGYYRYSFGSVTIPEGKNLQIQGYAVLGTAQGGTTAGLVHKNTTYVKEIASKTDKAVKVAEGNTAGEGYVYSVKIDGVAYFSKLTLTDLQKLYTAAGKTNVITA